MTYLKFRSSEALGITYYEKALANMMLVLKLVQVDDHEQSVMCKQSNTAGINQIFFMTSITIQTATSLLCCF